jgi:DNA processing protein
VTFVNTAKYFSMNIKKLTFKSPDYPELLREIKSPPNPMFHIGAPLSELLKRPAVTIVGSRRMSPYGRQVTTQLSKDLAEQGVVIVSGLAFGVDATAHRAAIDAGGYAIAVLPGPLDNILPVSNRRLAQRILEEGGALVSEYPPGDIPFKQNFIARNRIMAGLTKAVIVTEAGEKSGALYTANYAFDHDRQVLVVPGNINSPYSIGANNLLKTDRAKAVISYKDVLNALDVPAHTTHIKEVKGRNRHEQVILDLMARGVTAGEELLEKSGLHVIEYNQVLTMLEISSKIRPLGANHWTIY